MRVSKSFGYALRGVLFVAMLNDSKGKVQLDEIARRLSVPRHFLGKVMKGLVKEEVLKSMKGPYGGFYINGKTLDTTLLQLARITGDVDTYNTCILRFRKCNSDNPCPLHKQIDVLRKDWQELLASTTIGDLLKKDQHDFIKSIAVI